jgi:excisionase family DNA binding protein
VGGGGVNPSLTSQRQGLATTDSGPLVDGVLTAEEVAALLQVTPAWVYAETRSGRIPHLRLGRYVRYRRSALLMWMEETERASNIRQRSRARPPTGARR